MKLWIKWRELIEEFRPACSRKRTFFWLMVCLIAFSIRSDLFGVTSFVRVLGLLPCCYDRLLDFLHSPALSIEVLTQIWVRCTLKFFDKNVERVNGRIVIIGDGIKIPKEGKKMPSVKLLHQSSDSNTKAEYIMGHSCQAVSLLIKAAKGFFAVPLASRIHEGVVFSNRCKKTLLDKIIDLIDSLKLNEKFYFLADAFYASRKIIKPLVKNDNHLVTRVKSNAVAYEEAPQGDKPRKRGRPKRYGEKIKLKTLLSAKDGWQETKSPYKMDEHKVQYFAKKLIWRVAGVNVLFIAVKHPTRGKFILMTTDTKLSPIDVIRLYALRFKIEVSFKQSLYVLGTYLYHFWMKKMNPVKHNSGDQYLHHETEEYRNAVKRKIDAYHRYIQIGLIAQGLLQYLSSAVTDCVWKSFGSWIRTIRNGVPPSEQIVAAALKNSFPEFLADNSSASNFKKFIRKCMDFKRAKILHLVRDD